jgi:hypothetical protein
MRAVRRFTSEKGFWVPPTEEFLSMLLGAGFAVLTGYRTPGARTPMASVVIGPPGVFVVHDVALTGHVVVRRGVLLHDGEPRAFAQHARRQAMALQLLLGDAMNELRLKVNPLLLVRGVRLGWIRMTSGVRVASDRDLAKMLRRSRSVLSPNQVERLVELAEHRLQPIDGLAV